VSGSVYSIYIISSKFAYAVKVIDISFCVFRKAEAAYHAQIGQYVYDRCALCVSQSMERCQKASEYLLDKAE
jgi:hypothetical protein